MGFHDDRGRGDLGPPPEPFRIGGDQFRSPVPLRWIGVAAGLLVLFIALSVAKSIYVDVLWFDSVGFSSVFRRVIFAKIVLFFIGSLIALVVLGVNIWLARRLAPTGIEESFIEDVDPDAIRRIVTVLLVAATLFFAIVFGSVLGGSWETVLSWINGVSFGIADVQFGRDASFYLFTLPAYHLFQGWVLALLIVSTLGAGAVYALSFSLQRFELRVTRGMRIHLSVLVGLVIIMIAISIWLGVFALVSAPGGIVYGGTYTDINARLPVRYILIALALFAGLATIANAFLSANSYRLPLFAIGLWAFAGILGGVIVPTFVQSVQVDPNERAKEQQYIARNISATRYAWGLDRIAETPFPARASVTEEEFVANTTTIENIRLLDPRPLLDTINQIQAIRQFYAFVDVDVDRYEIDGTTRQVMIAARELDISRAQDTNWTRERLQLTHGYGAVVAPVNQLSAEGLPRLITSDIPPKSEVLPISLEGARIYFGELSNQYVIVNSDEFEFDYPLGEGNATTRYEEDRGIRLSSPLRRLALAWQLGDTNILISGQINSDSRLLMHRRIADRISKVAPFLVLDTDPYVVIDDGRLVWIQAAYTVADRFPYSQPLAGINYARDSVKIVVDALTGDMDFYLIDETDPVAATWAAIFPELFAPASTMPAVIREHLRYPLDLFALQSRQYLRYHITDPDVFFIGEDFWEIPRERFLAQEQPVDPYYVIMQLPDEDKTEFVLVLPFTPRNRPNTVAWLAGRSDGEEYGGLRAFRFPTGDLVYGPSQIEARIDQDPGISQQLSLWDQGGSQVIRGNLLMIPIGGSFLYVEPIYLQSQSSRLPELARVVIANGNDIAMEQTFEIALQVIRGQRASSLPGSGGAGAMTPTTPPAGATPPAAAPTTPPGSGNLSDLLQQAREASDGAQRELDRLRLLLDQIEQSQQ